MAKKRLPETSSDDRRLIETRCPMCNHQLKECGLYQDEDVYDDYGRVIIEKTPMENRGYSCPGCAPKFVEFMKSYCLDAWKKENPNVHTRFRNTW